MSASTSIKSLDVLTHEPFRRSHFPKINLGDFIGWCVFGSRIIPSPERRVLIHLRVTLSDPTRTQEPIRCVGGLPHQVFERNT